MLAPRLLAALVLLVLLATPAPGLADTGDSGRQETGDSGDSGDSGDDEPIVDTGKGGLTAAELAGEEGGCEGFGGVAALLWLPLLLAFRRDAAA